MQYFTQPSFGLESYNVPLHQAPYIHKLYHICLHTFCQTLNVAWKIYKKECCNVMDENKSLLWCIGKLMKFNYILGLTIQI